VLFAPQVVATQLLPAAATMGAHEATPVGPVVSGAGQVVVVQPLPDVAADAVQVPTATLVVLLVLQVLEVQLLPAAAAAGEQEATATLVVTTGAGQVVVV
jgi:hypothetical protein